MYLLCATATPARVEALRKALDGLGDSLLVVGGPRPVERPRPRRRRRAPPSRPAWRPGGRTGSGSPTWPTQRAAPVRAGHAGGGGGLRAGRGPGRRLPGRRRGGGAAAGPGRRASAGQILDEIRAVHALSVIVLPNDSDTQLAAEAAARAAADEGVEVHVVRSRAAVQGVAALAVFDPARRPGRATCSAMSRAAAATRHGAVTVASKEALTDAGPCRPGDVLGARRRRHRLVGSDLARVGGRGARAAARQRRRAAHRRHRRGRARRAWGGPRRGGPHPPPRRRGRR